MWEADLDSTGKDKTANLILRQKPCPEEQDTLTLRVNQLPSREGSYEITLIAYLSSKEIELYTMGLRGNPQTFRELLNFTQSIEF